MASTQELSNSKPFSRKKITIIILTAISLAILGYLSFSILKPESKFSIENFIEKKRLDNHHIPEPVKGTIENARIMIVFQDNIDEATAASALAKYAQKNSMNWNIFQDRVCSVTLDPLTNNLDQEITNLQSKISFESITKGHYYSGQFAGKDTIEGNAGKQDCAIAKEKIQALGYQILFSVSTPVLATVNTDTNKKQDLLNLLKKDTANFKTVEFDYPV